MYSPSATLEAQFLRRRLVGQMHDHPPEEPAAVDHIGLVALPLGRGFGAGAVGWIPVTRQAPAADDLVGRMVAGISAPRRPGSPSGVDEGDNDGRPALPHAPSDNASAEAIPTLATVRARTDLNMAFP